MSDEGLDTFFDMNDKSVEELLRINSNEPNSPQSKFYKKYKTLIERDKSSFCNLIINISELLYSRSVFLGKSRVDSELLSGHIEKIKKIRVKLVNWKKPLHIKEHQDLLNACDNLEKAYQSMRHGRGDKKRIAYEEVGRNIKAFWNESHENYFYDNGQENPSKANEFTDDFLNLFIEVDKTRGLKSSLENISDLRK